MSNIISCWKNLKFRRVFDCKMREVGFQDIADSKWLYYKSDGKNGYSFVIIMNKNDFKNNKVKLVDKETRRVISVKDIEETPYRNNEDVLNFLKEIYINFYSHGLIKENDNE